MSVAADQEETPFEVLPKKSRFTYRDLNYLNDKIDSYKAPLAVICHIDLNAFFAQVEQIRLNLTRDDPVVCVQWQAVIAVSYAARKFGINRMDTVKTCKEKCPNVILAHAAVYEKGNSHWNYLSKVPYQAYCKVSLDPYRRESRKIFKILKQNCDVIEKASVDEGFLDIGRSVYKRLLAIFPMLDKPVDGELPTIPDSLPADLKFVGRVYKEDDGRHTIQDWDDIIALVGSQILFDIRKQIYDELGYTTSGGLARNKALAKLAGGFLKPDNQVIVLNNRVEEFLLNFELIDIGGMGGKIGESILARLAVPADTNSIKYLKENLTKEDILEEPEIPDYVYDLIRGNHFAELRPRTDVKSMMSRKQFLPQHPIATVYDAADWIKVFAGDLRNRLQDLDDENPYQLRPKTVSVNLVMTKLNISKQCPIPVIVDLDKLQEVFKKVALRLLVELIQSHFDLTKLNNNKKPEFDKANPVTKINLPKIYNMAVIVTKLYKVVDNTIGKVTEKSDHIKKMFEEFNKANEENLRKASESPEITEPLAKRAKMDKAYINQMFAKFENEQTLKTQGALPSAEKKQKTAKKPSARPSAYNILEKLSKKKTVNDDSADSPPPINLCSKCNTPVENTPEHDDYHVALELSKRLNGQ